MRMLCCPRRSPRSFSNRLPGGHFKSCSSTAPSSMPSFRLVTSAGGEPRVLPVRHISAVARFAKLLITISIITSIVNNVKRYYREENPGKGFTIHSTRRDIFLRQVTPTKLYPWTALILLTVLNLLNYIDRSVLFA